MRVHFVYFDTIGTSPPSVQLGVAIMSSLLKRAGHQTSLSYVRGKISRERLIQEVTDAKPGLVGFSSNTLEFPNVKLASSWIKEELNLPIIVGGWHPTINPEEVISCKDIDMLCRGEGEHPMLELTERLETEKDVTDIPNLWIKRSGHVIKNPMCHLIDNLDELPFPDIGLFNYENILRHRGREATFTASRGCPFNCTFCCNNALRSFYAGKGKYVRFRSVDNVLSEIDEVTREYNISRICFNDDLFVYRKSWIGKFAREYSTRFNLPFSCNVRAGIVDEEMLTYLKNAGCDMIRLGIESGNEWLRRNVLKKDITNESIGNVLTIAWRIGLKTTTYNMIGLPYETPQMVEETLNLNKQFPVDYVTTNIFYPYQGTELYDLCKKEGFLLREETLGMVSPFSEPVLNLPTITKDELCKYYEIFSALRDESGIRTYYPQLYPLYQAIRFVFRHKTKHIIHVAKFLKTSLARKQI